MDHKTAHDGTTIVSVGMENYREGGGGGESREGLLARGGGGGRLN